MAALSEFARAALTQTDDQLALDCDWEEVIGPDQRRSLRLVHRATGLRVVVEARQTEAKTRFIALLHLRNRCYDLLRQRN